MISAITIHEINDKIVSIVLMEYLLSMLAPFVTEPGDSLHLEELGRRT